MEGEGGGCEEVALTAEESSVGGGSSVGTWEALVRGSVGGAASASSAVLEGSSGAFKADCSKLFAVGGFGCSRRLEGP